MSQGMCLWSALEEGNITHVSFLCMSSEDINDNTKSVKSFLPGPKCTVKALFALSLTRIQEQC